MTSFSRETHARATTRPTAGEPVNRILLDRRLGQRHAHVGAAVDDPHEPLGQAGPGHHARDPLARQAGTGGGLEDHPIAGQKRPGDLPQRLGEGGASGPDHADHPVGLVGDPGPLGGNTSRLTPTRPPAEHGGAVVGHPDQRVDRRQQLQRGDLGARPALLAGDHLEQLVEVVDHRLGHAAHVAAAVLDAQQRPQRQHLGDLVDDLVDLLWRRSARSPAARRWRDLAP